MRPQHLCRQHLPLLWLLQGNAIPIIGERLTSQLVMMEAMFNASWQTKVTVGSLSKSQVKGKFGKLIIDKTTGYAARWLY